MVRNWTLTRTAVTNTRPVLLTLAITVSASPRRQRSPRPLPRSRFRPRLQQYFLRSRRAGTGRDLLTTAAAPQKNRPEIRLESLHWALPPAVVVARAILA